MAGWISLHRSMLDHWLWEGESFTKAQAWIDLLLSANHAPAKVRIKGSVIDLERGQQARSMVTLSRVWRWSRDKVKRFMSTLVSDGMITIKTSQLTSVITICNYTSFQESTTPYKSTEKQQSSQQTSSRQGTNNNDNNEDNDNKKDSLSKNKFSDDDMNSAEYMFQKIRDVIPGTKQPNLDNWANTIRLMRERDNLNYDDMARVFNWANNDPFWQTNILCPSKLRDKYAELDAKSKQKLIGDSRGSELDLTNTDWNQ